MNSVCRAAAALLLCCLCMLGQRRVDSKNSHERVLALVPMTGAGTWADPKRPLLAPVAIAQKSGSRTGMIAWHFQPSDDGKTALVEFVFADPVSAASLASSISVQTASKAFQKDKDKRDDIEKAFKALRKDFDMDKFTARVQ